MDEIAIRRLYISDVEWANTSPTWKDLKPLRNFNEFAPNDESAEQCFTRLTDAGFQLPYLVIEQCLYPHYYNRNTINNYGWIDYRNIEFIETSLDIDALKNLFIIKEYRPYVERRAKHKGIEGFSCISKDIEHWKAHNTWRVPPVVLDVNSLSTIPSHAEIGGTFQLIEGHTRPGYLLALEHSAMMPVRDHQVFLMRSSTGKI
jgi:hypothetical protein